MVVSGISTGADAGGGDSVLVLSGGVSGTGADADSGDNGAGPQWWCKWY